MNDYVKAILRRKPDNIIQHVGTNDPTKRKATEIVNDIDGLYQEIKEAAPNVEIILSELIKREDDEKVWRPVCSNIQSGKYTFNAIHKYYYIKHHKIFIQSNPQNIYSIQSTKYCKIIIQSSWGERGRTHSVPAHRIC